ncbi:MAG: flavodoxin family protein [Desulfovibrionaceae bacterium]
MQLCLINASPHKKGFSDKIYDSILQYTKPTYTFVLRDLPINFCTHCNHCEYYVRNSSEYTKDICPLHKDADYEFFTTLYKAEAVILISPIYFYHLPSHLKAYIDRGQAAYILEEKHKKNQHQKEFFPILHAGRDKGKNLFTSSLLTLNYFFMSFDYTMKECLLLKNTDKTPFSSYHRDIITYLKEIL